MPRERSLNFAERRDLYFAQLAERGHVQALKTSGLPDAAFLRLCDDAEFLDRYYQETGEFPPTTDKQKTYLRALLAFPGNYTRARTESGVSKQQLDIWRRNLDFAEKEREVAEGIADACVEQQLRAASGRETRVKDLSHGMRLLGKLRPEEWGDKPKEVNVRYSGQLSVAALDAEILALDPPEDE